MLSAEEKDQFSRWLNLVLVKLSFKRQHHLQHKQEKAVKAFRAGKKPADFARSV